MLKYFSAFSGGVFCEETAALCGTPGTVSVSGHNYVVTHVTQDQPAANAAPGQVGFKLAYQQLPCVRSAAQP